MRSRVLHSRQTSPSSSCSCRLTMNGQSLYLGKGSLSASAQTDVSNEPCLRQGIMSRALPATSRLTSVDIDRRHQSARDWRHRARDWCDETRDWRRRTRDWCRRARDWWRRARDWRRRVRDWRHEMRGWGDEAGRCLRGSSAPRGGRGVRRSCSVDFTGTAMKALKKGADLRVCCLSQLPCWSMHQVCEAQAAARIGSIR